MAAPCRQGTGCSGTGARRSHLRPGHSRAVDRPQRRRAPPHAEASLHPAAVLRRHVGSRNRRRAGRLSRHGQEPDGTGTGATRRAARGTGKWSPAMNPTASFEDRLREELHDALDRVPVADRPWPVAHPDVHRRAHRRRHRTVVALAAVAAAAVVAAVVVAVQPGPRSTQPTPPTSPPLRVAASATFNGPTSPRIAAGGGALFVALWDSGTVLRLDAQTLHRTGSLRVGSRQNGPLSIAFGDGSVWVLNFADGRLWRINPTTMRPTAKIKLFSEPSQVAFGEGLVWVTVCCGSTHTTTRQRLLRIDPRKGSITGSVVLPGDGETVNVAVGQQAIVVSSQNAPILVIDPQTLKVERRLNTSCNACDGAPGIAVGHGSVFATGPTSVLRFDLTSGKVIAELPGLAIAATATPLTFATDGLWLSTQDQLVRLAAKDMRVLERVPLSATTQVVLADVFPSATTQAVPAQPPRFVTSSGRVMRLTR